MYWIIFYVKIMTILPYAFVNTFVKDIIYGNLKKLHCRNNDCYWKNVINNVRDSTIGFNVLCK